MSIHNKSKEIFNLLSKYLTTDSKFNPMVKTKVIENQYPLVVFETRTNTLDSMTQDMFRLDMVRNLSFEISVFAINKGNVTAEEICDELSNLICEVMQEYYGMQGGIDGKLQNINTAKATKYVLHFDCKWNVRQNRIY